jgi:RNA polymerase sigma-70 factor, ECF subfamily
VADSVGPPVLSAGAVARPAATDRSPEAELVAALRRRDSAAFEQLVHTHAGPFMQIARRYLKSPADVADVVQESFIAVFEGIDRFAGQAQLRTWMHRIVVNKALMRLRTQKRHGEVAIDDLLPRFLPDGHQALETQPWRPGADAELVSRHTQAQVRRAIDQLPEAYRTVLLLRDIDEIESSEAAQLLGITEGALRVRLHRARQALRGLLAPLFAESGDVPAGSEPVAASAGSRPCR